MVGLGSAQMNALLSSQAVLKHTSDLSRNRNMMKGEMGVLNSEIKTDKGRGIDTSNKEERVSELEASSNNLMGQIAENTDKLNDKVADDNEKINKEKAAEKAKEAEVAKAPESVASTPDGVSETGGTYAKSVDGDIVDISTYGRRMTAYAPMTVPETPLPQPMPVGELLNVKV
ncbi:MAG: hypothetical protein QM657_05470 [Lacrimispora sp.]|uniref:hypothetical protein n=1 Tax=Lacrimispora sp. TaxID=2719234 RepID=UPI0039E4BACE